MTFIEENPEFRESDRRQFGWEQTAELFGIEQEDLDILAVPQKVINNHNS